MPPGYNHPARVAERIATLDLVSNGRVDFGTGRVRLARRARGLRHRSGRAPRHVAGDGGAGRQHDGDGPLPGLHGQVLLDAGAQRRAQAGAEAASAAVGRVLEPRDHPPRRAARHRRAHLRVHRPRRGARSGSRDYYETFKRECVPIGHAVNPNIAMVTGFSLPRRRRRGARGAAPTASASSSSPSATTTASARTRPGRTNIWNKYVAVRDAARHGDARRRRRLHRHARRAARDAPRRSRTRASTRPSSSSRAARTGTRTSASRSSCSRPR